MARPEQLSLPDTDFAEEGLSFASNLPSDPIIQDDSAELVARASNTTDVATRKDLLRRALDLEVPDEECFAGLWVRRSAVMQRLERVSDGAVALPQQSGDDLAQTLNESTVPLQPDGVVLDMTAVRQRPREADRSPPDAAGAEMASGTLHKQTSPPRVTQQHAPAQAKTPSPKATKSKRVQATETLEPAPKIIETPVKSPPLPKTPSTPVSPVLSERHIRSPRSSIQSASSGASTPGRKKPKKLEVRSPRSPAAVIVETKAKKPKKLEIRSMR